ncbi:TrmH family RNA methyltransferase [Sunxiuqinia dokdonensis]|nr:RNA methyltransferase [Sunxiuqinia dokdonensis]
MLSKNKIKFIQSLSRKKTREQEGVFLVEGNKVVLEALSSGFLVKLLVATSDFLSSHAPAAASASEVIECNEAELKKASQLKTPQEALAIVEMPDRSWSIAKLTGEFSLALDFIQDPGNLGTIIRIADWFGIKQVLCSENSVDCYNPKVIQASMGAIFRVQVNYLNLNEMIEQALANQLPVYGTFLEGENIYISALAPQAILVMGNEGNGISPSLAEKISQKIHIPSFASGNSGSESLNVATATAICCSEFKRRIF